MEDWKKTIAKNMGIERFLTVGYKKRFAGYGWRDAEGEITTDPKKVVRKVEYHKEVPIIAKGDDDFETILQREADKANQDIKDIAKYIADHILKKWEEVKETYQGENVEVNRDVLAMDILIRKFHGYCYNYENRKTSKTPKKKKPVDFNGFFNTDIVPLHKRDAAKSKFKTILKKGLFRTVAAELADEVMKYESGIVFKGRAYSRKSFLITLGVDIETQEGKNFHKYFNEAFI